MRTRWASAKSGDRSPTTPWADMGHLGARAFCRGLRSDGGREGRGEGSASTPSLLGP